VNVHLSKHIVDYRRRQTGTLRISENVTLTNDDVMNYVIGALQYKLPLAPLPCNTTLSCFKYLFAVFLLSRVAFFTNSLFCAVVIEHKFTLKL